MQIEIMVVSLPSKSMSKIANYKQCIKEVNNPCVMFTFNEFNIVNSYFLRYFNFLDFKNYWYRFGFNNLPNYE